jgi:hypothetical protein
MLIIWNESYFKKLEERKKEKKKSYQGNLELQW